MLGEAQTISMRREQRHRAEAIPHEINYVLMEDTGIIVPRESLFT